MLKSDNFVQYNNILPSDNGDEMYFLSNFRQKSYFYTDLVKTDLQFCAKVLSFYPFFQKLTDFPKSSHCQLPQGMLE